MTPEPARRSTPSVKPEPRVEGGLDEAIGDLLVKTPEWLNIAELACARHARANPEALAIVEDNGTSDRADHSFAELEGESARIGATLKEAGVGQCDLVAVHLPQSEIMLATLLAALRLGAVAVPIAVAHGPDALALRLDDCGARVLVTDAGGEAKVQKSGKRPSLERVLVTSRGDLAPATTGSEPPIVRTRADDPALLFYTSGSSGNPKGVLLAHRLLLALLPGFRLVFDLAPKPGDLFWTPSEWSWLGGLQVVLCALYFGQPVLASIGRFSNKEAYRLLSAHEVTCAFLAPAALRRMRAEPPPPGSTFKLRAIMTGGEVHSPDVIAWAREAFSCSVNDDYGLTEANDLAVGCGALFPTPDGASGRPVPGRRVVVLDDAGACLPPGEVGEIAVDGSDPVRMLGYWNPDAEPPESTKGGWFRTGDLGYFDEDGFLYVVGRRDSLILVSGYRVGPDEVEIHLLRHPSVVEAGVVAIASADGASQSVGACVVLRPGTEASDRLRSELQRFVKEGLAPYAVPRRLEFVDHLPTSPTEKTTRRELRRLLGEPPLPLPGPTGPPGPVVSPVSP